MPKQVDLKEFVAGFLLEAEEHLHSVNKNLVSVSEAIKKGLPEPRAIRELFRSIHTIKGLASMVGAAPIADVSHEMESILRLADRGVGVITERSLNLLLQGTRAIEERVNILAKEGLDKIPPVPANLLEALALDQNNHRKPVVNRSVEINLSEAIQKNLSASDKEQIIQATIAGRRVVLLEFQPSTERANNGFTITTVRDRLSSLGELVKVIPQSSPVSATGIAFLLVFITAETNAILIKETGVDDVNIQEVTIASASTEASGESLTSSPGPELADHPDEWAPSEHSTIRVDVRRLDEALERLSELVVTRFKMSKVADQMTARGVDTRELNTVIADHTRQLKRLRAAITESRMVPLAELLQRVPLIVRGITRESGKLVDVRIQASTAEVDKAVADKIFPAIVHLVRNAVDHALESAEERKQSGKNEVGALTIICDDSSGTSLLLSIVDDGRGIDREAVARKSGKHVAKNDEELLSQITIPGLSTRDEITQTSGRGMGMDIVKKTIELLGGMLSLETTAGKGTTFTMRVPVSITIIDTFSFISAGQTFVAPIAMVDEIIEVDPAKIVKAPVPTQVGLHPRLIQHRGDAIPLFDLESLLKKRASNSIIPSKALIVRRGSGALAFGVDRMLGQQEVVVRPLDKEILKSSGMVGATDLGDGLPTLVLDLATLGTSVMSNAEV